MFQAFQTSSMPRRALRYALSRLDFLDTEALDLENLDWALGRTSVLEFRHVGLQLDKIEKLLQLPAAFRLQQAKVLVLRVTVPMDFYTSPILVAVDGVQIRLRLENNDSDHGPNLSRQDPSAQRAKPRRNSHHSTEADDDEDAVLPDTANLAQSFLETQTEQDKQELEEALLSETLASSAASSSFDEEDDTPAGSATTGTGQPLSLPAFLTDFLQGIVDRVQVTIANVNFHVDVPIPATPSLSSPFQKPHGSLASSQILPSRTSEWATFACSVDRIHIEGVTSVTPSSISTSSSSSSSNLQSTPTKPRPGKRHIALEQIHASLMAEPHIFAAFASSTSPPASEYGSSFGSITGGDVEQLITLSPELSTSISTETPREESQAGHDRFPPHEQPPSASIYNSTFLPIDSMHNSTVLSRPVDNIITSIESDSPVQSEEQDERQSFQDEDPYDTYGEDPETPKASHHPSLAPYRSPHSRSQSPSQPPSLSSTATSAVSSSLSLPRTPSPPPSPPSPTVVQTDLWPNDEDDFDQDHHPETLDEDTRSSDDDEDGDDSDGSGYAQDLAQSRLYSHEEAESMYLSAFSDAPPQAAPAFVHSSSHRASPPLDVLPSGSAFESLRQSHEEVNFGHEVNSDHDDDNSPAWHQQLEGNADDQEKSETQDSLESTVEDVRSMGTVEKNDATNPKTSPPHQSPVETSPCPSSHSSPKLEQPTQDIAHTVESTHDMETNRSASTSPSRPPSSPPLPPSPKEHRYISKLPGAWSEMLDSSTLDHPEETREVAESVSAQPPKSSPVSVDPTRQTVAESPQGAEKRPVTPLTSLGPPRMVKDIVFLDRVDVFIPSHRKQGELNTVTEPQNSQPAANESKQSSSEDTKPKNEAQHDEVEVEVSPITVQTDLPLAFMLATLLPQVVSVLTDAARTSTHPPSPNANRKLNPSQWKSKSTPSVSLSPNKNTTTKSDDPLAKEKNERPLVSGFRLHLQGFHVHFLRQCHGVVDSAGRFLDRIPSGSFSREVLLALSLANVEVATRLDASAADQQSHSEHSKGTSSESRLNLIQTKVLIGRFRVGFGEMKDPNAIATKSNRNSDILSFRPDLLLWSSVRDVFPEAGADITMSIAIHPGSSTNTAKDNNNSSSEEMPSHPGEIRVDVIALPVFVRLDLQKLDEALSWFGGLSGFLSMSSSMAAFTSKTTSMGAKTDQGLNQPRHSRSSSTVTTTPRKSTVRFQETSNSDSLSTATTSALKVNMRLGGLTMGVHGRECRLKLVSSAVKVIVRPEILGVGISEICVYGPYLRRDTTSFASKPFGNESVVDESDSGSDDDDEDMEDNTMNASDEQSTPFRMRLSQTNVSYLRKPKESDLEKLLMLITPTSSSMRFDKDKDEIMVDPLLRQRRNGPMIEAVVGSIDLDLDLDLMVTDNPDSKTNENTTLAKWQSLTTLAEEIAQLSRVVKYLPESDSPGILLLATIKERLRVSARIDRNGPVGTVHGQLAGVDVAFITFPMIVALAVDGITLDRNGTDTILQTNHGHGNSDDAEALAKCMPTLRVRFVADDMEPMVKVLLHALILEYRVPTIMAFLQHFTQKSASSDDSQGRGQEEEDSVEREDLFSDLLANSVARLGEQAIHALSHHNTTRPTSSSSASPFQHKSQKPTDPKAVNQSKAVTKKPIRGVTMSFHDCVVGLNPLGQVSKLLVVIADASMKAVVQDEANTLCTSLPPNSPPPIYATAAKSKPHRKGGSAQDIVEAEVHVHVNKMSLLLVDDVSRLSSIIPPSTTSPTSPMHATPPVGYVTATSSVPPFSSSTFNVKQQQQQQQQTPLLHQRQHQQRPRRASLRSSPVINCFREQGYVEVCYLSGANITLNVLKEGTPAVSTLKPNKPVEPSPSKLFVHITDPLVILETCADSTQTLIKLVGALTPPTPPSQVDKYRTCVMPVEDLLASISAEAFGVSEGAYDFDRDFAIAQELAEDTAEEDEDELHSQAQSQIRDPKLSGELSMAMEDDLYGSNSEFSLPRRSHAQHERNQSHHVGFDGVAEKLFDAGSMSSSITTTTTTRDTADGVLLEFGEDSSVLAPSHSRLKVPHHDPLQDLEDDFLDGRSTPSTTGSLTIYDEHFDDEPQVAESSAKLWDGKRGLYRQASKEMIQRCPVRVEARKIQAIWKLYDGYDWQHTRDVITKAVDNVEKRAYAARTTLSGGMVSSPSRVTPPPPFPKPTSIVQGGRQPHRDAGPVSYEKEEEDDKDDDMMATETDEIGDLLFNSIYIGISKQREPDDLRKAINRNLHDPSDFSDTASMSTITSSAPHHRNYRQHQRLRLVRSRQPKISFELHGIDSDVYVYPEQPPEPPRPCNKLQGPSTRRYQSFSGNVDAATTTQSCVDVRVDGVDVLDHLPTSTWRKFATYDQDAGEREMGSSMAHIELLSVKPTPDLAASEFVLRASLLPLRLHVDQDALDFITRFFEFRDDRDGLAKAEDDELSSPSDNTPSEEPFVQRAEIFNVSVKLDFKPKRVDYAGLRSGHTTEFMNFVTLEDANLVLRHTIVYGIRGFDRLGKTLNDIWMPDVKRTQLPTVLAGLASVRSLVNVGNGIRNLVEVPIQEYRKDGRIIRSLSKGASAFARTTGTELVKLGAKVAVGTQYALLGAEGLLTTASSDGSSSRRSKPAGKSGAYHPRVQFADGGGNFDRPGDVGARDENADEDGYGHLGDMDVGDEYDESEGVRPLVSLYADQPTGVLQGLRGGYASLARDLHVVRDAIIAVPGEVMESPSAQSVARAVWKRAPTLIFRPAIGATKALGQTLLGATNSLDPANRRRVAEKYKHT